MCLIELRLNEKPDKNDNNDKGKRRRNLRGRREDELDKESNQLILENRSSEPLRLTTVKKTN